MPSAMSSPSEPVETTSISIDRSFLPSFMIEPLPKFRSIWDSATSSALDLSLSIEFPSTTRNVAAAISSLLMTGIRRSDKRAPLPARHPSSMKNQCTLFVLCSQYVLFLSRGTGPLKGPAPYRGYWPVSTPVAGFELSSDWFSTNHPTWCLCSSVYCALHQFGPMTCAGRGE